MQQVDDYLFRAQELSELLQMFVRNVRQYAEGLDPDLFRGNDDDVLVRKAAGPSQLQPVQVSRERATMKAKEATVQVVDPFRNTTSNAPGFAVTYEVPFSGTALLWEAKAVFTSDWPRGSVRGSTLILNIHGRELDREAAQRVADRTLDLISEHLAQQEGLVRAHNENVMRIAASIVADRRKRIEKLDEFNRGSAG